MPTCLTIKIPAIIRPVQDRTHNNSTISLFLQANSSPWECRDTHQCSLCNRCTHHPLLNPSILIILGLTACTSFSIRSIPCWMLTLSD